jgi:hypothetical protein
MITIPRETAEAALVAISTCHSVMIGKHSSAQIHLDAIAALNAHQETLRVALAETHDHEACLGLTCSCNNDLSFMDDVSIHDPQTPHSNSVACCHKCAKGKPHPSLPGLSLASSGYILCPQCGNKRCPKASDHDLACTGSNEPGQPGSVYGPQHTLHGLCPSEFTPDSLDPDCPACKTLLPRKGEGR